MGFNEEIPALGALGSLVTNVVSFTNVSHAAGVVSQAKAAEEVRL